MSVQTKKQGWSRSVLAILYIMVIAFCAIFLTDKALGNARLDLTEEKLYNLSDGTQKIVQSLPQKLTLKLFYSKEAITKRGEDSLLRFNNMFFYVRDLLQEYVEHSHGRLSLEIHDPKPFSDEEMEADRLGLTRLALNNYGTVGFYFGLAIVGETGGRQVIEMFDPNKEALIEYQVTSLIDGLGRSQPRRMGLISSLPMMGDGLSGYMAQMMRMQGRRPQEAWIVVKHLQNSWDVEDISTDSKEIDPTLDVLMVVHPKEFSDETLYAIDQYIMQGGKALVFVDPHCLTEQDENPQANNPFGGGAPTSKASQFDRMLSAWGLSLPAQTFAGDMSLAQMIPGRGRGQVTRFVGMLSFDKDSVDSKEVAVSGLDEIALLLPGVFEISETEGVQATPMIQTTESGGRFQVSSPMELGMGLDPQSLNQKFQGDQGRQAVALRLSGTLASAFPEGPPEVSADESEEPVVESGAHLTEASDGTAVIVVSDVDMLADPLAYSRTIFGVTPNNDNSLFVMNALEYLAGSTELVTLRGRGGFARSFTVVDQIEKEADERSRVKEEAIQAQIENFQNELNSLGREANEKNIALIQNEAIKGQRELQNKLNEAQSKLRRVQRDKLNEISDLGDRLRAINCIFIPGLVLIWGVGVGVLRYQKRQSDFSKANSKN